MMEFQWKWLVALLILVMVPEKATSAGPRVVVQATGDTWITLQIEPDHVRGKDVAQYRIDIDERFGGGKDTRFVSKNMARDTISVTLGELSPSTTYRLTVTPIYRDRSEGESASVQERTRHADMSKYGGKDSGDEMMSSGTALTSYGVTYFIIVSWVVGFSVNM